MYRQRVLLDNDLHLSPYYSFIPSNYLYFPTQHILLSYRDKLVSMFLSTAKLK